MNRLSTALIAAAAFAASPRAFACAVCFGDPGDPQTKGMNAAIVTLLGITYGLFFAMFAAGIVIWRRGRRIAPALDADSAGTEPGPSHG